MPDERAPDPALTWRGVLVPLADLLVPADRARAGGRVRNFGLLGAALPWLLPRAPDFGLAGEDDAVRASVAFGVAAVAAHVTRRSWWGGFAAAGTIVAAAFVAGPCPRPWAFGIAGIAVVLLVASLGRRAAGPPDAPDDGQTGLAGIAWSVLFVLVVREFAILPIRVPTGSMQPTIYGARPHATGDHLLVDRPRYLLGDPQRWDVAVFDFPLHRPTTFVKRVIGLPGETVEIADGDVWIDGRIARKPPRIQESLWRGVFPRPNPLAKPLAFGDAWRAADAAGGGGWAVEGNGVRCTPPRDGRESVLRFTRRLDQGDLRVRFRADLADGATAAVRIRSRGHVVSAGLTRSAGSTGVELSVDGEIRGRADADAPDEVFVADGLAVVRAGGREVVRADVPADGTRQHGIELVVRGGPAAFRDLRVDQDQRWVAGGTTTRWEVPAGAYFVLGDNADRSEDSRAWRVTEIAVRGRPEPIRVAPTYPGDRGEPVPNLRVAEGDLVFHDADGIPRRIARSDVERRRDGLPAPFVPRDHFLGRASVVFWPWVPAEGGFRPRLLP